MYKNRIALFHSTLPIENEKPGGVSVVVDRLAEYWSRSDDITVFSLDPKPTGRSYKSQVIFAGSPFLRNNQIARLFLLPLIMNFLNFKNFDIIYFFGDDWFYLRRSIPTVRIMSGSALNESKSATNIKRKIAQRIVFYLEKVSIILASTTISLGPDAAKVYKLKKQINVGIDTDLYTSQPKSLFPTVLFVGTWEGRKRGWKVYDDFLNDVLPIFPNARLYMVCDKCPDHPSVDKYSGISDKDLSSLFCESWVFAFPSTYEGFGVPYLEAMASKTAIVTSENPGSVEILEGGRFGLITKDEYFGIAIRNLINDDDYRLSVAEEAYRRVKLYDWPNVIQSIKDQSELYNVSNK